MADKQKIQKRCTDILGRLKKGPASILELMKISGVKERMLKEYIKDLRVTGNEIELRKDLVTLHDATNDAEAAESSSHAVVRQVGRI